MENEVVIHVRTRGDDARRGFMEIERDARRVAKSSGDALSTGLSGRLLQGLSGLGEKLTSVIGSAAEKLPGVLGSAVSAMPPQGQAIALVLVGGLAAALGPLLAAAISSAVLLAVGGGVLAVGIAAAAKDPKVKAAFGEFGKTAKDVFKDFGEPFRAPLIRAARTFGKVLQELRPDINRLGEIIAPVIDKLAPALGKFMKNALPGIEKAVKASVPLFETLAEKLPLIGSAVGDFFEKIAGSGPDAQAFFDDLLTTIIGLIEALGTIIGWMADFYSSVRRNVSGAIRAFLTFGSTVLDVLHSLISGAAKALGWMPGLGPKLRHAAADFGEFRQRANRELDRIRKSVTITARFRVLGMAAANAAVDTARILKGMGYAHGGIVGAATGGVHSGLRMVGERGPELVDLPPGTQVHSNPDTQRLMSGGKGPELHISADLSKLTGVTKALMEVIRMEIRAQGGNVQQVLGVAGR